MLQHAVRVGGAKRLHEQREATLVDRRRGHLHRRGEADLVSDDVHLDPRCRKRRDLGRTRAGEVDDRRARGERRPSGDRPVDELEPRPLQVDRDRPRSSRGDRVEVGHERGGAGAARRRGDGGGHGGSVAGRHDRKKDVRRRDDVVERREQLEPVGKRDGAGAASGHGRHGLRAAAAQGAPDGGAHGAGADDADDSHRGEPTRLTAECCAADYPLSVRP